MPVGEKVSPEEALRGTEFELLRQLQKAVRTVILTATVSNSCVNCSHALGLQLFRLIRSCLLAGCRRFRGVPAAADFLFLLVVPEFAGAFRYDLEFIAHLCVSHGVASFVKQLFEDERRVRHFYCDAAIMRDEELHLAFVSSLMALEPVNFHPDSKYLAQQTLSASLENLHLIPVQWRSEGSGKLEDHVPAARPDKAVPRSDLGALSKSAKSALQGFVAGRKARGTPAEAGPAPQAAESAVESEGSPEPGLSQEPLEEEEQPDLAGKLDEVATALNETEELVRLLELEAETRSKGKEEEESRADERPRRKEVQALLSDALNTCCVLELEDAATECPCDEAEDAHAEAEGAAPVSSEARSAADLGGELADAFGLGSMPVAPVPEVEISLRDLVAAGRRARQAPRRSSAPGVLQAPAPATESRPSRAVSPEAEPDEADDAVAALEGLWHSSRRDTARRLMRASISTGARSTSSDWSSTMESSPHPGVGILPLRSASSCDSDSNSEHSGSVSSSSYAPQELGNGVHLEWRLRMHTRLPKDVQVMRQQGLCLGCQRRLSSSLFQQPRYCHYLGLVFCTKCHLGDIRVIPARVAERWDFEPRKVCHVVAKYLDLQVNQPLVPITSIRRTKASSQEILTEIHMNRQKLTKIREMLTTSGCDFQHQLQAFLSQLDAHVARGHEFYAMQDLIRVHLQGRSCPLYVNISRCVAACAKHIHSCETCAASASFCPICGSNERVFPFEVASFHACGECQAVFHQACFRRAGSTCPFCAAGPKPAVSAVQAR
ncbi:unnamed protein product [Effrenium voratum]|uniref:Phorbol-ester/DAG-type domain-containing protein n=1 Tax=Effrenium voratum TaxID=2562239 RepID=A0AA36I6D4_9DINO|nr:unnamed protein product [Effrenium voratum]CAJ1436440.1 unnamed protein product [Effrenium voratum]